MFVASYFLKTIEKDTAQILEVLRSIETPVQFYKGCRKASAWQDSITPEQLMVFEIWETKKDLEEYIRSSLYRRMLAVFEMCSEKPEIRFMDCKNTAGLEWIEQVLMPPANYKPA